MGNSAQTIFLKFTWVSSFCRSSAGFITTGDVLVCWFSAHALCIGFVHPIRALLSHDVLQRHPTSWHSGQYVYQFQRITRYVRIRQSISANQEVCTCSPWHRPIITAVCVASLPVSREPQGHEGEFCMAAVCSGCKFDYWGFIIKYHSNNDLVNTWDHTVFCQELLTANIVKFFAS